MSTRENIRLIARNPLRDGIMENQLVMLNIRNGIT